MDLSRASVDISAVTKDINIILSCATIMKVISVPCNGTVLVFC